jgi:hypothetical protein
VPHFVPRVQSRSRTYETENWLSPSLFPCLERRCLRSPSLWCVGEAWPALAMGGILHEKTKIGDCAQIRNSVLLLGTVGGIALRQARTVTASSAPLNVYWQPELAAAFENLRDHLARRGVRLSKTQLGEIAVNQLVARYGNDVSQLVLDLGVG